MTKQPKRVSPLIVFMLKVFMAELTICIPNWVYGDKLLAGGLDGCGGVWKTGVHADGNGL